MVHLSGQSALDVASWSAFLQDRLGLDLASRRWEMCEPAILRVRSRLGIADARRLLTQAATDAATLDAIVEELTVGETYFFRDPVQLEFLRQRAIPDLLLERAPGHSLTLWSAGCASGEEPYSLAILLREMGLGTRHRVLGTDISRARLASARLGVYGKWSLRGVSEERIERCFRRTGVRYALTPEIRSAVTFDYGNLAEGDAPAPVRDADVILCRNVLIYLDPVTIGRVIHRLIDALAVGGWLVLGASDPPLIGSADAARCDVVMTNAGLVYRRRATPREPGISIPLPARAVLPLAALRPPDGARAPDAGPAASPEPLPATHAARASAEHPGSRPAAGASGSAPPDATPRAAGTDRPDLRAVGKAEMLAAARRRRAEGDVADAANQLQRYVAAHGDDAEGWGLLVRTLGDLGQESVAERTCVAALARCPGSAELRMLHALLLTRLRRYDEAVSAARGAVYLDRTLVVAHLALGGALAQCGERDGARRAFVNALQTLESRPVNPSSHGDAGDHGDAAELALVARSQLALLDEARA